VREAKVHKSEVKKSETIIQSTAKRREYAVVSDGAPE